jgi:hypothetical protein
MNLPDGIFHESFCVALARYHANIAVRASNPADKIFHGHRADALADCAALPSSQMRWVMLLSERFPAFGPIRENLVATLRDARRIKNPTGVLIL